MELKGTLHQIMPAQTGQGKNGPWKKQDFLIEIPGTYPKKALFTTWNDRVNLDAFKPGQMVTVYFDLEAREYNGRWYNDVKAWKIEGTAENGGDKDGTTNLPTIDDSTPVVEDDLPF
jgi:hypothetical protein